jgi:hypothetical protein
MLDVHNHGYPQNDSKRAFGNASQPAFLKKSKKFICFELF